MRFDAVSHDVGGLISAGVDAKGPVAALISAIYRVKSNASATQISQGWGS